MATDIQTNSIGEDLIYTWTAFSHFYNSPLLEQTGTILFRSCSGVAYCYLTAFRDSMYFKKTNDKFEYKALDPDDSFCRRLIVEPLYLLLAVAAVVETVARTPLMFVGLAIAIPIALRLGREEFHKSDLAFRVQELMAGMAASSVFVVANCRALFYNLFNTPIILSNIKKPVDEKSLLDYATSPDFLDA